MHQYVTHFEQELHDVGNVQGYVERLDMGKTSNPSLVWKNNK